MTNTEATLALVAPAIPGAGWVFHPVAIADPTLPVRQAAFRVATALRAEGRRAWTGSTGGFWGVFAA